VPRVRALVVASLLVSAPVAAVERPRFQAAIGLGVSEDRTLPDPPPHRLLSSFFFSGGFWGDGLAGVDLNLFANGAPTSRVNRIAGELVLVLRPMARRLDQHAGYTARVLRTLAVEAGPALERVGKGFNSDDRFGVVLGAHVDLPIGPPSDKELRLRLGVRRMLAQEVMIGEDTVGDSAVEAYGMLAVVF
jgi:hypothetical protein